MSSAQQRGPWRRRFGYVAAATLVLVLLVTLIGADPDDGGSSEVDARQAHPTASPTKQIKAQGGNVAVRVVGATMAQSFGPPLNLRPVDDGRSILLLSVEVQVTGDDSERLD